MAPGLRMRVRISGADEVLRAIHALGRDAEKALRDQAYDIADYLADKIKYAASADSRQSARAASSVKAVRDRWPVIIAGGTKRSQGVLFGSEFGATRRFGWYARARYYHSPARQFRPHQGASSYWFFATAEREQPWVERQWQDAADDVIRRWSA
jgi:hypothetical protein